MNIDDHGRRRWTWPRDGGGMRPAGDMRCFDRHRRTGAGSHSKRAVRRFCVKIYAEPCDLTDSAGVDALMAIDQLGRVSTCCSTLPA